MKKTALTTAAAIALLALSAGPAGAKPGSGHGNSGQLAAEQGENAGHAPPAAGKRCRRMQSVGFAARGSLASFTPETLTLDVKKANRHARSYIATAGAEFTLASARVKFAGVTDADASGTVDFADVQPTDVVTLVGKATRPKRGCSGDAVLTLHKVQVVRPGADTVAADGPGGP